LESTALWRAPAEDGIMTVMKFFFLVICLTIAVSIACSGYRSSGSPTVPSSPPSEQPSTAAVPSASDSQETTACKLTLGELPAFKGLKLGMTTEEVLAVFPGSKVDEELRPQLSQPAGRFGTSNFIIKPPKYPNKENFAGISQIAFSLLDGRVYTFTFSHLGPEYAHVDKFVEKVVEGTNLPAVDQWEAYQGLDTQMKILACKEFEIRVYAGGEGGNLNYVLVKDQLAENTLKDRRKKAREQAPPSP
jgi:hypothetical protein